MNTFGEVIYRYRTANNISLREFAQRINKSPTFVSFLENNKNLSSASEETIESMARVLKLDKNILLKLAKKVPEKELKTSQEKALIYFRKNFKNTHEL